MGQFSSLTEIDDASYAVCYDNHLMKRPVWTANRIKIKNVTHPCEHRGKDSYFSNSFNTTIKDNNYINTGFDRGHMSPSADFCYNLKVSFNTVNMVTQSPKFNQGIWKVFEEWIRKSFPGSVVVTVALKQWGDEFSEQIELGERKILVDNPIGYCKLVLNDDETVNWWGCIKYNESRSFKELLEFNDFYPPNYGDDDYPTGA